MVEIKKFTVGPRIGMLIIFLIITTSGGGGFYFGWQSYKTWGLKNEVAVLKDDAKVGKKIRDAELAGEKKVEDYARKVKRNTHVGCRKLSVAELISMCTAQKSE